MIYTDGVPMDEKKRVLYCPRCKNQEIDSDAEYCHICGLSLYNVCVSDWNDDRPQHQNSSNARYCKICGRPTEYHLQNILRSYEEVMKHGLVPAEPLEKADTTYDRLIEMSIVTNNSMVTAEDMQEFGEILQSKDVPF